MSVHGADPIAEVKFLISPILYFVVLGLLIMIYFWVFKQFEFTCNDAYIINNNLQGFFFTIFA